MSLLQVAEAGSLRGPKKQKEKSAWQTRLR
jgi:hypothetical protein